MTLAAAARSISSVTFKTNPLVAGLDKIRKAQFLWQKHSRKQARSHAGSDTKGEREGVYSKFVWISYRDVCI